MEQSATKSPSRSFTWVYILTLILALAMLGAGVWLVIQEQNWIMLACGGISVFIVATLWPLTSAFQAARREQGRILQHINETLDDRLEQMGIMLNLISEQQLISDRAKSIAFHDNDISAIRRVMQHLAAKGNWAAASALVGKVESVLNCPDEAATLRQELGRSHSGQVQKTILDAMTSIDRCARAERWAEAHEQARQLLEQFPDNDQVKALPGEIDNRRQQHKQRLIASWHDAVARKDIDGSIEILKQLDLYLTPAEAQHLQDSARSVFKEKLQLLRLQFATAVQDHRWAEAVSLGEQITTDFPNTRIAQEVSEKMEALRQRASQPEEEKTSAP
ncbi:MAG: hypothetical protein IT448_10540 [Phycisphaerales bacterium]|nr:hypothetical protein [Phycisphaerales bacterium]